MAQALKIRWLVKQNLVTAMRTKVIAVGRRRDSTERRALATQRLARELILSQRSPSLRRVPASPPGPARSPPRRPVVLRRFHFRSARMVEVTAPRIAAFCDFSFRSFFARRSSSATNNSGNSASGWIAPFGSFASASVNRFDPTPNNRSNAHIAGNDRRFTIAEAKKEAAGVPSPFCTVPSSRMVRSTDSEKPSLSEAFAASSSAGLIAPAIAIFSAALNCSDIKPSHRIKGPAFLGRIRSPRSLASISESAPRWCAENLHE